MALWELGEIAHVFTWPWRAVFGHCCWCEDRRTRWNAYGERLLAYWRPRRHATLLGKWTQNVRERLDSGLADVEEVSYGVSSNTATRWLGELAQAGKVAVVVMNDKPLYGLPAERGKYRGGLVE